MSSSGEGMSGTPAEVPEFVREKLGATSKRQRFERFSDGWILVIHRVPELGDAHDRVSLVRYAQGDGPVEKFPGDLSLEAAMEEYGERMAQFEEQLEDELMLDELFEFRRALFPLARALRNAARVIEEAHTHLGKKAPFRVANELSHELMRRLELLESDLAADIGIEQSEIARAQADASRKLERRSDFLNTLVGIFLPITAITSAFGMNFSSGFDGEAVINFWTVVLVGFGGSLAVALWVRLRI